MLHCEVLQLPCTFYWLWIWLVWHGRDWSVCVCVCVCVCVEVGKMAKDIGMTIRKGIVVPFLPCLVAFWGFHPYMFFHFLNVFLLLVSVVFLWGGEKYEWCLDGLVVWGR